MNAAAKNPKPKREKKPKKEKAPKVEVLPESGTVLDTASGEVVPIPLEPDVGSTEGDAIRAANAAGVPLDGKVNEVRAKGQEAFIPEATLRARGLLRAESNKPIRMTKDGVYMQVDPRDYEAHRRMGWARP